ncbi:OmpA-OmpF porin, OOP family [Rhodovulum sp. ES.010]|uniref:OmpA family protein n=1 Tax=Rhodovulum sp. ES.010 TaxID=1882821 RepID=UPI00092B0B0E|nr:OmpA family protein [Rhodovulum sp. ES.010]SIO51822.1 OmpA-OmpF porin, OOP family [Rhodovulum sp. ES.010]
MSAPRLVACTLAAALAAKSAGALAPDLPDAATLAAEQVSALGTAEIPVGDFDGNAVPTITAEGPITRRAWQQPLQGLTTRQVLAALRAQVVSDGFHVIHECAAARCGGFDFRYAIDILPEPAMHVDLGDFRFLSARRLGADGPEYVTLMVSRSATRAFVQVTGVGITAAASAPTATPAAPDRHGAPLTHAVPLVERLERDGRAVLAGLDFATGSATLTAGEFASLEALARYLEETPNRSIMLVGHTDAVGALDSNIALSRRRAEAVRNYLIDALDAPADRVAAAGAGFLAPLASNRTEEGRMRNRRVEVILTTTD